jgi:homopolymeric O-antigen transport system permease protein
MEGIGGLDDGAAQSRPTLLQMLRALWQYRPFIGGMVGREFRIRYLNSLLGFAWAFLNPLATIAIYTLIFAGVMAARLPGSNDRLSYSLYLCAGLFPWLFFSELVMRSVTVFLENAPLLKKASFPRACLPLILVLSATVNFAILFGLFLVVLAALQRFPGWSVLAFLPLLALQQAIALGLGLFLGTMNVFFRDVGHFFGIAVQYWFWLTPIVYTASAVPAPVRPFLQVNPMTAIVAAYQGIVLGGRWPHWEAFFPHAIMAALLLGAALLVFRRLAGEMVDEL